MYRNPRIDGFTRNPTLMRKARITDYVAFAKEILGAIQINLFLLGLFEWFGGDETTGLGNKDLGPQCLRENSGNEHQACFWSLDWTFSGRCPVKHHNNPNFEASKWGGGCPSRRDFCFLLCVCWMDCDTGKDPFLWCRLLWNIKFNPNAELVWASPLRFWMCTKQRLLAVSLQQQMTC